MALTVVHFTDEIDMVEISTFRDRISIVVPDGYRASLERDISTGTLVHLTKKREGENDDS